MEYSGKFLIGIPLLYSRISFVSSHFHMLFAAEAKFQEESAKLKNNVSTNYNSKSVFLKLFAFYSIYSALVLNAYYFEI